MILEIREGKGNIFSNYLYLVNSQGQCGAGYYISPTSRTVRTARFVNHHILIGIKSSDCYLH